MTMLKEMWSWLRTFGVAFVFALFVGIFIFQPYKVVGHSMDPTLHDNERLYVSKLSHTFSYVPNYEDIVIIDSRVDKKRTFKNDLLEFPLFQFFLSNADDHSFYVKRLIGKPGDTIELKEHKVYRNGEALQEPYIKEIMNFTSDKKWVVPDKYIFVMGDNRNNSNDSRSLGFIPLDHVLGKKLL